MTRLDRGIRAVPATVIEAGAGRSQTHEVVVEEPLEIRLAGEPLGVTMRTPGEDRFLALGLLLAEGVIRSLDDVGSVFHCGRSDDPAYGNALDVLPGPGVCLDRERVARARRDALTGSACGMCGRQSIADLIARLPAPRHTATPLSAARLHELPALLVQHQPNFARTGGLHAACAVSTAGEVLAHAEDIGRHNAVDKVVGKLLYAGRLPAADTALGFLAVSGRASFEIVQKAAMAGFACVASVSAPSSLAIETAHATGITLASFVRDGRFSLYSHAARIRL